LAVLIVKVRQTVKSIVDAWCTIGKKANVTFTSVRRLEIWIPQGKSSCRHIFTRVSLGDGGVAFLERWSKLA
jgi:hypothetical protein